MHTGVFRGRPNNSYKGSTGGVYLEVLKDSVPPTRSTRGVRDQALVSNHWFLSKSRTIPQSSGFIRHSNPSLWAGGFRYVLIMTDLFAKFVESVPMKNQETSLVVKALEHGWLLLHGYPFVLLSVQGCNVDGTLVRDLH